ncbi:MAG: hypothetical protein IJZ55_05190 [Lachnospiraceae bacterium]|nr:hypothetical protein [Lachnospiraceae bacterium]
MTERKLWNGWNRKIVVLLFFLIFMLLNHYMWMIEAEMFEDELFDATIEMSNAKWELGIQLYHPDLIRGTAYMPGVICTVFFTAFLAVVTVHRESFFEQWDVTLRRIPKYRGKYLFCKMVTVLLPGVVYLMYYLICWQRRWELYLKRTREEYLVSGKKEFLEIIPKEPFLETALYLALTAMALLLLSFTVRRIKKDVLGFVVAIAGLLTVLLLFSEAFAVARRVEIIVLSVSVGIVFLFNIRHVYWKW